jgi:hypothetical protein
MQGWVTARPHEGSRCDRQLEVPLGHGRGWCGVSVPVEAQIRIVQVASSEVAE